MAKEQYLTLLREQVALARSAEAVLRESFERAGKVLAKSHRGPELSAASRETLEALTSRFDCSERSIRSS